MVEVHDPNSCLLTDSLINCFHARDKVIVSQNNLLQKSIKRLDQRDQEWLTIVVQSIIAEVQSSDVAGYC